MRIPEEGSSIMSSNPGTGTPASQRSRLRRSLALFRLQASGFRTLRSYNIRQNESSLPPRLPLLPPLTPPFVRCFDGRSCQRSPLTSHLSPTHLPIYPGDRLTRLYALCIYPPALPQIWYTYQNELGGRRVGFTRDLSCGTHVRRVELEARRYAVRVRSHMGLLRLYYIYLCQSFL